MNINSTPMIRVKLFPSLIAVLFAMLIITSCKKSKKEDPEPELTAKEKAVQLMTANGGKWSPAPLSNWVTVEGVNVTDLFKDFSITFTATGYTTSGTSPVWPRIDTWHFKDDTATSFIRDSDGKEVTITISETTMKIVLTWDKGPTYGGRPQSINGKHEFNLVK